MPTKCCYLKEKTPENLVEEKKNRQKHDSEKAQQWRKGATRKADRLRSDKDRKMKWNRTSLLNANVLENLMWNSSNIKH